MLNFDFLDKSLGIVSLVHFLYDFSTKFSTCYILLTDQISLSGCLYFLRYWEICVLQLFVITRLLCQKFQNYSDLSNQAVFIHDQKVKKLNILRRRRAFKVKLKTFFIILKGLSVIKNCPRP